MKIILKAFSWKAYPSCHGFVGSEFKQDYFIREGLVRGNDFFFFQVVLSTEHSQGAAGWDGSSPWGQGSGSLTGSPGDPGDRGAGL